MDDRNMYFKSVDCIYLAQERGNCGAPAIAVMNLRLKERGEFNWLND